ncbi:MAG: flagellin, partial [Betaproteobacteria bacterium]|nr:flagellin [Betaproteobacteria bacterium]
MTVINTNVKALYTQAALKTSGRQHAVAMQQLSTGKRINSAKDDAAGLAIAAHMTAKIRSLNQAVRNAGDAVSLIQTAEGATNTMSDMLQRMSELTIQASNATYSPEQRGFLDEEFQQLKQEISRVSEMHEWNGFPILSGLAGKQVGPVPPLSGAMAPVPGLPTKYKLSSEPTPATAVSYAASNIHAASGLGAVSISGNFAKSGTV